MRTLRGYLLRTVLAATGLVLLVLLALAGFIEFIGQLDNTGEGSYSTAGAALYVGLRLPLLAVDMLAIAALLGALLGLGALAGNSELVAMRAAGISARRLAAATALSGVLLAMLGLTLGEYIAPPLDQFARKYRSAALNQTDLSGQSSTWVRHGERIFNVGKLGEQFGFGGAYIYELAGPQRLGAVAHADRADVADNKQWILYNFAQTQFASDLVVGQSQARVVAQYEVDAELLGIAALRPGSLSIRGLWDYLNYLKLNRLDSRAYATEFWGRIADAIAIVLMPVLAIGFVFGSLRSSGAGSRLLVGVLIGLAYFLGSKMLANSGQVFALQPAIVAFVPVIILAATTAFAVLRVR